MVLQEINYKMPIYKDCTLGEMLSVGATVFFCELLMFSVITKILIGFAAIGVAATLISFFHMTKYCLAKLQKIKYDKPYGYYQQLIFKKLAEGGLINSLYITRIGKWSIRRMK